MLFNLEIMMQKNFVSKFPQQEAYQQNVMAQPFLKWAGGKRQLLPVINKFIPQFTQYYEPFIGAGAVLFAFQPVNSTINDTNSELVNCYQVIKNSPQKLLELCQLHKQENSKEYFYHLREQDRQNNFTARSSVERAARIIYLNKTCFNGLFRVNRKGQFNVPYGNYTNPTIADPEVIKAVSTYLNQGNVSILCGDFEQAVAMAKSGAFIYFDPPYYPLSNTSSFTSYSLNGFGGAEQIRLKKLCDNLSDRGCKILLSNSSASLIRDLYSDFRYQIVEVDASRSINSVSSKRGKIKELLIHNKYDCERQES